MKMAFYSSLILVSSAIIFIGGGLLHTSIEMNQEDIIAKAKTDAINEFLNDQPIEALTNIVVMPTKRADI
jgi:hypothetical protein